MKALTIVSIIALLTALVLIGFTYANYNSNKGPFGPIGPSGPTGIQGAMGAVGPEGRDGSLSNTGPRGPTGPLFPLDLTLDTLTIGREPFPTPFPTHYGIIMGNSFQNVSPATTTTITTAAYNLGSTGYGDSISVTGANFVINQSGFYIAAAHGTVQGFSNVQNRRFLRITTNEAPIVSTTTTSFINNQNGLMSVCGALYLNRGQTLSVVFSHNSGSGNTSKFGSFTSEPIKFILVRLV